MAYSNLNICLFPMRLTWQDVAANLVYLENSLQDLHPHTDLLVLPETFSTGYPVNVDKDGLNKLLEINSTLVIAKIKELAKRHNVAIVGSLIVKEYDEFYNRGFFIEPTGDEYYADKRHLFSMAGEDKIFTSGNRKLNVRFRGWNISMFICYDIRFPVWCRNEGNKYDLMLVVANWPKVRIGAWSKLLPARAIENEAYVAAVNCCGNDTEGYEYDGTSYIFDYKGNNIEKRSGDLLYASLSLEKLHKFREKFPAWKDADSYTIN